MNWDLDWFWNLLSLVGFLIYLWVEHMLYTIFLFLPSYFFFSIINFAKDDDFSCRSMTYFFVLWFIFFVEQKCFILLQLWWWKKQKNRFASIVKHCSQVKSLKTPPPTTVKLFCLTRLLHFLLQTLRVMFYKQNGGFTCLLVGKTVNKRFEIQWGGGERLKSFANKKSKVSGNEQYNGR